MNNLEYAEYIEKSKKAHTIYTTIRDLYGWELGWPKAYYNAITDRLLSKHEKNLVKDFYPIR